VRRRLHRLKTEVRLLWDSSNEAAAALSRRSERIASVETRTEQFLHKGRTDLPGALIFRNSVNRFRQKYFSFSEDQMIAKCFGPRSKRPLNVTFSGPITKMNWE